MDESDESSSSHSGEESPSKSHKLSEEAGTLDQSDEISTSHKGEASPSVEIHKLSKDAGTKDESEVPSTSRKRKASPSSDISDIDKSEEAGTKDQSSVPSQSRKKKKPNPTVKIQRLSEEEIGTMDQSYVPSTSRKRKASTTSPERNDGKVLKKRRLEDDLEKETSGESRAEDAENASKEETAATNLTFIEKKGDLFKCSDPSDSLAHCVSLDFRMDKGIALEFKEIFGGVEELKKQAKKLKVGDVAKLKRGNRYIFYLITKTKFNQKPSYKDLKSSLKNLRNLCLEHSVKSISMPRIGCGLDKLRWDSVSKIIKEVFQETKITINIYTL